MITGIERQVTLSLHLEDHLTDLPGVRYLAGP